MFRKTVLFCALVALVCSSPAYAVFGATKETAAASVPRSAKYQYGARNLGDWSTATAWCTRAHRKGDAWMALSLDAADRWDGFGLVNGYARDAQAFKANARARAIAVYVDGKLAGRFRVKDTAVPQWFAFRPAKARRLKVVVEAVYPGARDDDLCVSEVITDARVVRIWQLLDKTATKAGGHALTPAQAKALYQSLKAIAFPDGVMVEGLLENAVSFYAHGKGEAGYRLSLDVLYAADLEPDLNVPLMEGLGDSLIPWFESDPQMVLRVLKDEHQLKREEIAGAYAQFVDPFFDAGALERYQQAHPALREISHLVDELNKQQQQK